MWLQDSIGVVTPLRPFSQTARAPGRGPLRHVAREICEPRVAHTQHFQPSQPLKPRIERRDAFRRSRPARAQLACGFSGTEPHARFGALQTNSLRETCVSHDRVASTHSPALRSFRPVRVHPLDGHSALILSSHPELRTGRTRGT